MTEDTTNPDARDREAMSSMSDLSGLASVPEHGLGNTLFECGSCERLVETQFLDRQAFVPDFCPWCGEAVFSILGRELDGYRIESLIAQGGFGILYLAANLAEPAMKAAVKFLRPEMIYHRPELVRVFVEEARLTEEIGQTCWNVVRVFNVREKPWPYFFSEYIRGSTLDAVIEANDGKVPLADGRGYLRGIANALAATHSQGRVHRDLKPMNIMVLESREGTTPEERIKLLDFGLSLKIASAEAEPPGDTTDDLSDYLDQIDSPLQQAGTPEYMASEAFDGINEFAGDIYSFGVTAYEALTGQRPWPDPPLESNRFFYYRDAHKTVPPRPIREVRPELPARLGRVIMECLEKSPGKRIPSADVLLQRLKDPVSRWVWVAAAGVILAAVSAYALKPPVTEVFVNQWRVDGKPYSNPLELWARDLEHLATLSVTATAKDLTRLTRVTSDHPGVVDCELVDTGEGQLMVVRFRPDPSLAQLTHAIAIKGDGWNYRLRGEISIRIDATDPEIGPLRLADGVGPARELGQPPARIRTDRANLEVTVTDEHLSGVSLTVVRISGSGGEETDPEPIVLSCGETPSGARTSYSFSLSSLENYAWYRAFVIAEDHAGRSASSQTAVEFQIDNVMDLPDWNSAEQTFFARKTLFYKIHLVERLSEITRLDPESERWKKCRVYAALEGVADSLALSDSFEKLKLIEVPDLKVDGDYLLAVPIESRNGPQVCRIRLSDTAEPPNEKSIYLTRTDLPSLSPGIVSAIEVDEHPMSSDASVYRLPVLAKTQVEKLQIIFSEDARVHRADLSGLSDGSKGDLLARTLVFKDVQLKEGENAFTVTVYDGFGAPLSLNLSINTDTTLPRGLDVDVVYNREHRLMKSADDAKIVLVSDEPLSEALMFVQGRASDPVEGTIVEDSSRWMFKLSDSDLVEGTLRLQFKVKDLASNRGVAEHSMPINLGAPEIQMLGEDDVYSGEKVLLKISDGNGVDASRPALKMTYRVKSGDEEHEVPVNLVEHVEDDELYDIPLIGLPDKCKVTLTLSVPDRLGLWNEPCIEKFEFRRLENTWRPSFTWRNIEWMYVANGADSFYVAKYEISNGIYNNEKFIRRGRYVDAGRKERSKLKRPAYWGRRGELPKCKRQGKWVPGDDDPVVGIHWREAEAFALFIDRGGRLPSKENWLEVVRLFSWPEELNEEARSFLNFRGVRNVTGSPLATAVATELRYRLDNGKENVLANYGLVKVDYAPLPPGELGRYFEKLPRHLFGNVGELVRVTGDEYAVMGGDCEDDYDRFDPQTEKPFLGKRNNVGFRVVIDLNKASVEFREQAQSR